MRRGGGIGLHADRREEHPDWITGIASPPPIARLMAVLKQCNPAARRVGVAWNPAESNAVASLKIARAAMAAIGLELVEANAATTGEVRTAVDSLLGSGIDAFWIPPDINAQNAAPSILTACRAARVPVFASFQKFVGSGAAVGVGADYDAIGREVGRLVVRILDGEPPSRWPTWCRRRCGSTRPCSPGARGAGRCRPIWPQRPRCSSASATRRRKGSPDGDPRQPE